MPQPPGARPSRGGPIRPSGVPPATVGPASGPPASGRPGAAGAARRTGRVAGARVAVRDALAGTPGRLRVVSALSIVAALAFGLIGSAAVNQRAESLATAKANAAQLVRIQAIRTDVVQADADATNAFLVGGLEPPDQRADYLSRVATA